MDQNTGAPASNRAQSRRKPATTPSAANLKRRSCSAPSTPATRRAIPDSIPRYTSFKHIRNPKVRRAKEYEQHLLFLQAAFPEYSTGLEDDLAYARSQQERGRVSDRDRVFNSIERSPLSCREISEDLELPYQTTYKILQEFAVRGVVVITTRPGIAGNKPTAFYQRMSPDASL